MTEDMYGPELKEFWVAAGYTQDSFALHLKQSPIAHLGIGISAPTLSKLVTQNLKVPDMLATYALTTLKARPGRQARLDACRAAWREKKAAPAARAPDSVSPEPASESVASASAAGSAPANEPSVGESLGSGPESAASAAPSLGTSASETAPAASAPEPHPSKEAFAKGSSASGGQVVARRVWTRRVRLYRRARQAVRGRGLELALVGVLVLASGALVYGHEEAKYSVYLGRLLELAIQRDTRSNSGAADDSARRVAVLALVKGPDVAGNMGGRLTVPAEPYSWQKKTPCNANAYQIAINGGCWVDVGAVPCRSDSFEHNGRCYLPVEEREKSRNSESKDSDADGATGEPRRNTTD